MSLFSIQLISHLRKLPKESAPSLAILGNCSIPLLFSATRYWDTVYLVPGLKDISSKRGEQYTHKIDTLYSIAHQTRNLFVLNHGRIEVPGKNLVLLGTPLYEDTAFRQRAQLSADYAKIYGHKGPVSPLDLAEWHWQDKEWLKGQIGWYKLHRPETQVLCLTHSNPFQTLSGIIGRDNGLLGWFWAGDREDVMRGTFNGSVVGEVGSESALITLR